MRITLLVMLLVACGGKSQDTAEPTQGTTLSAAAKPASGRGQPFPAAMRVMCDAPRQCCQDADAANKATELARWITERVTNEDARQVLEDIAAAPPENKVTILTDAAKRANIDAADCGLVEVWTPAK
jgi:hypothetical protein